MQDVAQTDLKSELKLIQVLQTQWPSNGDRMTLSQRIIIHDLPEEAEYIKKRWSKEHVNIILSNLKKKASEKNYEYIRHCISCDCEIHLERENDAFVMHGCTPCNECGGIEFSRTGTCHVCLVCGSSQGCS